MEDMIVLDTDVATAAMTSATPTWNDRIAFVKRGALVWNFAINKYINK